MASTAGKHDSPDFRPTIEHLEDIFQFAPHPGVQTISFVRTIQFHPGDGFLDHDMNGLIGVHGFQFYMVSIQNGWTLLSV